ncbi:hypothetical protein P5673_021305 [Acropora cervicornis]|uniref:Uncharacterized protein n=1 Tax=Acropora cervicornis TaxID=6130 RepID=A0AAD9Q9A6_ACRCE|nr:hypothetical protein P5673_021305 [Acropora cervicornis]
MMKMKKDMGNAESSKKKQQIKTRPQLTGEIKHGKMALDAKNILLLHKSNAVQLKVVRNFRDALISKTEGTVEVTDFINIVDESKIPKSQSWLEELHNVVLLCLTSEAIDQFRRIILDKGFADQNGFLHPKVFSVTFGEKLASEWPPKGLRKGSSDLRDFCFGFTDVQNVGQRDFENSLRMSSLIAAIKLTR